jgi:hypothetical protein
MAEETTKDGRHYLTDVTAVLAAVGPKLDAGRQAKIEELTTRGERVQKKLFLKTQGGTDLAAKAADIATKLQGEVDAGAPEADINKTFDELVEALEFFIHRAETLVIRMT